MPEGRRPADSVLLRGAAAVFGVLGLLGSALADGQLLATGGVSTIEGSAGGGVVPWAVLAGYGTSDEWGGSAFASTLNTGDYRLDVAGGALTFNNRLELSLARQSLRLSTLGPALGLGAIRLEQDVVGAKLRLYGDLIYGDWPQLALGVQHKRHRDFAIPSAVGARSSSDTELYLSATRLFLAGAGGYNLLVNGGIRYTRANQAGLLGFGGDQGGSRRAQAELSAAVLLNRHWAVGADYRQQPDLLGFAKAEDWRDLFVAWFPNGRVSVVLAYVDLGDVATLKNQRGWYFSVVANW